MRRAIAAAVMGGLVLGGAVATPSVAAARGDGKGPGKARQAAPAKPRADSKAAAAMKTVVYAGYEFQVPASWPVYRLDEHPQTCVRYDVHAVYLGTPGTDMRCPARAVGRTQTVSFIPGQGAGAGAVTGAGAVAGSSATPAEGGGTELQRLPAVNGTVRQNAAAHKLEVALGPAKSGATVLGTYGTDPAVVEQVFSTLRQAPAGTAPTVQSAPAGAGAAGPEAKSAPAKKTAARGASAKGVSTQAAPAPVHTNWRGVPPHWPVEIVQPPPRLPAPPVTPPGTPPPAQPVNGFDTCATMTAPVMRAWRSTYAAAGVYIGGINAACRAVNISPAWVRTVVGMGWGLLPIYVGPQAPCWIGGPGVLINPASAAAQGRAAATDAVSDVRAVGLAAGSPIYYDMEGYGNDASCAATVLTFLGAWDRQVNAAGYVTGVYSSRNSGILNLQAAATAGTAGFTAPNALWIASWDTLASLSDSALSTRTWPLSERSKQFTGSVNVTVGGITLNIDEDIVGGPMARLPVLWTRLTGDPPARSPRVPRRPRAGGPARRNGSREPPWPHKLTTWPYAATALTPSST